MYIAVDASGFFFNWNWFNLFDKFVAIYMISLLCRKRLRHLENEKLRKLSIRKLILHHPAIGHFSRRDPRHRRRSW